MNEPFREFVDWAGGIKKASELLEAKPARVGHVYRGIRAVSRDMAERVEKASGGRWKRCVVMWPELTDAA